jgi:hypothetical protein
VEQPAGRSDVCSTVRIPTRRRPPRTPSDAPAARPRRRVRKEIRVKSEQLRRPGLEVEAASRALLAEAKRSFPRFRDRRTRGNRGYCS